MNIKFEWENKYSVGNDIIDQQHMKMFELGNQLPEISDKRDIKRIIMSLYRYIREHFSHEEEMMKSIGFPLLADHKLLHENLITKLNRISSQPLDSDESIYNLKEFIYDWLTNHILYEDNKYFQFSNEINAPVSNKPNVDDA